MEEKQTKMKKSTKYLLIGTLVLFLSILGASVAYYLARVSEEFGGRAAGTELTINVQKISSNATGDLIPLDNDLETLNLAAAGYQDKGACVDINGYSVCQIYHITLTNNGTVPLTVNGTVTLSGQNTPNIDCATMTNATTVANNNSCMGGNVFVSGDTLAANDHNDYYVMVYIKNLDEPQTDSGEFNGTVTFTTEDGKKVKGRFTKPFNLVQRITKLYNDAEKTVVTANAECEINPKSGECVTVTRTIDYNYATNVGLMNDRLGGTTTSLDGGNIRYYGAEPNNYVDIGNGSYTEDLYHWQDVGASSLEECANIKGESQESCATKIHSAGDPILWRIIGVFDGKLRVRRDDSIGAYSFDTSSSDINSGYGINEWSQADLMRLLNPGFNSNTDFDTDGTTKIPVNNSLYWNSESGKCYNSSSYENIDCDFTNSGLSEEAKEYVVDQTLYLGGFDSRNVFANQAWEAERGNNVFNNTKSCYGQSYCNDTVERTLTWTGKVGLIYPSDFGYAADFSDSNCQGDLSTLSGCSANWMAQGYSWTVSPWASHARREVVVGMGGFNYADTYAYDYSGGWPTLLLDSSVLAESGNGSLEHPYVVAY